MKAVVAFLSILALAAAFGLGQLTVRDDRGLATVASFEKALEDADPVTRSLRLSAFLEGLGPGELPEVLEALEAKKVVGVSEDELKLLMLAWTRFDAPGAFEWAISRRERPGWPMLAPTAAMFAWGFRDPAAARLALDEVEEEELKRTLKRAIVRGWIRSDDKQGVTDYLVSLPRGDERQVWTNWLAKELLKGGVGAVIAWADAVPEDAPADFKRTAFRIAANAVATADTDRAVAWYEANQGSDYAPGALRVIARRWAEHHDPAALFEWLIALPQSSDREVAVRAGFASWLGGAPDEARAWLREAPRTAALDPAFEHLAQSQMTTSFPASAEWAVRIQEPKRRKALLIRMGRRWSRQAPGALEAWVAENELSEEDRETLLAVRGRVAARAELSEEEREAMRKRGRLGAAQRAALSEEELEALLKRVRARSARRAHRRGARSPVEPELSSPVTE